MGVMSVFQALILGVIQGLTALLPVSSSGHLVLAGSLMGTEGGLSMRFLAGLHMGTLLAALFVWRRDVSRIFKAAADLLCDLLVNLRIWAMQRGRRENLPYRRLIYGRYRGRVVFLATATACTFAAGLLLRYPAERCTGSLLYTGMGFFVTALMLLIAAYAAPPAKKGLFSARDAVITGIAQGIAVFPGISRMGMVMAASDILGLPHGFGVYIGYLLCVPAVFGGLIIEIMAGTGSSVPAASLIAGILSSAAVSAWMMKRAARFLARCGRKGFALYCLLAGIVSLLVYL